MTHHACVFADEAAEIIGDVWKVETIGDCYKAVVGGFAPCKDHAQKAMALASSILKIIRGIAHRCVRVCTQIVLMRVKTTATSHGPCSSAERIFLGDCWQVSMPIHFTFCHVLPQISLLPSIHARPHTSIQLLANEDKRVCVRASMPRGRAHTHKRKNSRTHTKETESSFA